MIPDPLIGRLLGAYRVEQQLGSGGMAVVYYGWDVKLNRPAAIKVINAYYRDDPTYAERFVQEARTVANWRHENIIQIYYADDQDGLFYFAMEYIDGQNLADILSSYLADGELVPYEDVLLVNRAIAGALDYAHQKGVIHRDVKPSNVFLERGGRVVLGDFGLSLNLSQGSMGEIFGSAHYIAPEQARRSNAAVPASDLYSLAVILYEMLTGVVPFDDPSPSTVALMHMTASPTPPRQINPNLSPQIEAVLLKALSKSPQDRYPSGTALMDALEAAMTSDVEHTTERFSLPPLPAGMSIPPPKTLSKLNLTAYVDYQPRANFEAPAGSGIPASPPSTLPPGLPPATPAQVVTSKKLPWLPLIAGCGLTLVLLACVTIGVLLSSRGSLAWQTAAGSPTAPAGTEVLFANLPGTTSTVGGLQSTPVTPALSDTPTPSSTAPFDRATDTPAFTPTHTPTPTALPASSTLPGPISTVRYPDGRRFTFFYHDLGFFLLQVDGDAGPVSHISFERLNEKGKAVNTFSGQKWAKFSAITKPGWCLQLLILGHKDYGRPAPCKDQFLSTRYIGVDDKSIFWTSQPSSQIFRVLWKNEEVARCEIQAQLCEVRLP